MGRRRTQVSSSTDIRSCLHHRLLGWDLKDIGPEMDAGESPYDRLGLSDAAWELIEEARRWKKSEEWYKSRGIPWRRGWLLHGRPGTGKTALARAVAEDLDLPVYAYDLATLHNDELRDNWSQMLSEVPCMALLEDLDAVFEGRKNVSAGNDKQALTFDCLLNCLDGIQRSDGLCVVITTNRLDKVDEAIGLPDEQGRSSRPGRIDRVLELPELDEEGRWKIVRRILMDWPDEWSEVVINGSGDTGAQFQERCARKALEMHFDASNSKPTVCKEEITDRRRTTEVVS